MKLLGVLRNSTVAVILLRVLTFWAVRSRKGFGL